MNSSVAKRQLSAFMARYSPEIARIGKGAVTRMRRRLPGAVVFVYDNYYALVVGVGPTPRPSEAVFSIVLYPKKVTFVFLRGRGLPDPQGILEGSGKQVRHIPLRSAAELDLPAVRTLISAALERAAPFRSKSRSKTVVRAVAAKRLPRRPQARRA